MSTLSCTISGIVYPVKNDAYGNALRSTKALEVRGQLTVTIIDMNGTFVFTPRMPITIADSVTGEFYQGFIQSDVQDKYGPASAAFEHVLTCFDNQDYFIRGANTTNYTGWYSGDIVTNFVVNGQPGLEGATVAAGLRRDTTAANFNTGILSGTAGYTSTSSDGDLELLKAGSDVTITESTTANFATGTLTNVQAVNNTLTPTTVSALKLQSSLAVPLVANSVYVKFWNGAFTVGSSDTLNYDIWVASTSPQISLAVDLTFSDGSFLHSFAIVDQNGISATPGTDLSSYAKDQWYTRTLTLTGLTGKIINVVMISAVGTSAGTYTGYIKNCYLGSQSGSPFFSTSATTTNVNPPLVVSYSGFSVALTSATVVQAWIPNNSYRISTAYSIDAIKLLRSSIITWIGAAGIVLSASYDGGNTYAQCTNNGALPALPAGSNVAGLGLTLKEAFGPIGADPTILPTLTQVTFSLFSAPNATKSDIVGSFYNSTTFNTGTYSGLGMASDGVGITCVAPLTRDWNNLVVTGQSLFPTQTNITESASTGAYVMTIPGVTGTPTGQGQTRLDFAGSLTDFTLEVDIKFNLTTAGNQLGVTYRQTYWDDNNNTFAYYFGLANGEPSNQNLIFGYGSNSSSASFVQLATATFTPSANTTYHVKIVVAGTSHKIYFNGAGSPTISVTDSTYTSPGYFGFRAFGASTVTNYAYTWDNFSLDTTPSANGTWTGPSTSISTLVTCGLSAIAWTESNTAASGGTGNAVALIQTSIDGGSTYQTCTNGGAIASLPSGTNVSGKSLLVKVTLTTTPGGILPEVARLVWRVLGQYPGSSGTRTTAPMGIDYVVRANQSGFGNASDGQSYVKVGTGTDAVASNKLTITNTTGDVHEKFGARTGNNLDGTIRFSLSTSTITDGMELRYIDTNNYYRLAASTTALSIIKKSNGVTTTLKTVSATLSTGTLYYLHFRAVGFGPTSLYGRVWASGTLEPTTWTATITD